MRKLILVLVILSLSACNNDSDRNNYIKEVDVKDGETKLTILVWGTKPDMQELKKQLIAFQEKNRKDMLEDSSVKAVNLKVITVDSLNYSDKLLAMHMKKDPPDIFYLHTQDYFNYVRKGDLYDISKFLDQESEYLNDYFPEIIERYTVNDRIYALPKDWTTFVLYYNRDLFRKYGIPFPNKNWTWDDLLKASKALTHDLNQDNTTDIYGITIETWADWYLNFILQNGGLLFNKDMKWVTYDKEYLENNIEGIQYISDLVNRFHVVPDTITVKKIGNYKLFIQGKAAMSIYGRWAMRVFKDIRDFTWDFVELPTQKTNGSTLVSVSFAVSSHTPFPEQAWEVVKFLNSSEGQLYTTETGLSIPSRISVAKSDAYLKPSWTKNQPFVKKDSIEVDPFISQLEYATLPPTHPAWHGIRQKMDEQLDFVFNGNMTAEEAFTLLNSVTKDILRQYKKKK